MRSNGTIRGTEGRRRGSPASNGGRHRAGVRGPEYFEAKPPLDVPDLFQGISGIRVDRMSSGYSFDVSSNRAQRCRPSISIDGLLVQVGRREGANREVRPIDPEGLERVVGSRDLDRTGWQDIVNVVEVAAIEVFAGGAGLPDWVAGTLSPCGAILIWTKGYVQIGLARGE